MHKQRQLLPPALCVTLFLHTVAATVFAQAGKPPATKPALPLVDVVAALVTETESYTVLKNAFVVNRPHPLVARLNADPADVMQRLIEPLTGDDARDTYIRYHLLHAVLADGNAKKTLTAGQFADLTPKLAPEIKFEMRQPKRAEPPDVFAEYEKLLGQCRVVTGFPPFQKTVQPPESFQFMDAAKRAQAESAWAQAQTLIPRFKIIVDNEAIHFNIRMNWVQWMARQVRGEMVYGMLMTGDAKAFDAAFTQIKQAARRDPALAAELLAFVNAAYFDGWLGQYDPARLKAAAMAVKKAVIEADKAIAGAPGPKKTGPTRQKDLSELAFTVITAMETGTVPARTGDTQLVRPPAPFPPLAKRNVTPATLNLAVIDDAIARGVAALEKLRPPDTDLGTLSYTSVGLGMSPEFTMPGQHALATWAMLSAGESPATLWMQKRVSWLACFESITTYDRAMRLAVLGRLPYKRWEPWIRRDVEWLTASITDKGNFNINWPGGASAGFGDNANGQYAALGLWAAEQAGHKVDEKLWKKIDQYWRDAQFPGDNAAGWATRSYKALTPKDDRNAFANRVAGPMTAAGILSLTITERYLNGPKLTGVGNTQSKELAQGLKWLDTHYSTTAIDGDADLFYYLWTIQNVGQATGYRTFNKIDWYRDAMAVLLNQQQPDGLWKGPKGTMVSTSFALMYLARARGPLAISKLRFGDGSTHWNNRPNDLVNFTDYISAQLEVPTSWQIADLEQPTAELIESATLYLATDKPFTLSPQQIDRLREYLNAGGLLIAAPEGGSTPAVIKSLKSLAAALYPDFEPRKVDGKHPFFNLFQKVNDPIGLSMIDNGIRPLMVIVEKDISRELQMNQPRSREAFNLLANVYLYAAGQNPRRARIATDYVLARRPGRTPLKAARIRYAGAFDPEPAAMPQLQALVANAHDIRMEVSAASPGELSDQRLAFLTVSGTTTLPAAESAALKKWVDAGGTLWLDAAAGSREAVAAVDATIERLGFSATAARSPGEVPGAKALMNAVDPSGPAVRGPDRNSRLPLAVIEVNGRPAVYLVRGDFMSAIAGLRHAHISGLSIPFARQLATQTAASLMAPSTRPAATQP